MTCQSSGRDPLSSVPVMEEAEVEEEDDTLLRTRRHKSIRKVREWQQKDCDNGDKLVVMIADQPQPKARPVFRGRTPSYEALRCAVTELHRIDDFDSERLGEGFFSEVFKVTHKTTGRVMVLKKNKYRSNSLNSLKEIQLMNKLRHPNILKFEAVCVHEGQLHALTEFIDGGTLEEFILDKSTSIAWSDRIRIGGEIAEGLSYLNSRGMFHRDLTSKNIFMKKSFDNKLLAIIGDFGLATRIPARSQPRLPQVGSPYWMSPECLRGEFYDQSADIFSFGIIMCELIARVEADPDILPRTNNFGVEYKAFSELCPTCPADFLKLTFTCVSIDPESRPSPGELVTNLSQLLDTQAGIERQEAVARKTSLAAFKKGLSDSKLCDITNSRRTPSEKARLHSKTSITSPSSVPGLERAESNAKEIGEEMARLDPHYSPTEAPQNPFTTLPRMREGRKIIGSHAELFSSCAEIPITESNHEWFRRKSLPYHLKQYLPSLRTKDESSQSNSSSETIETSTPKTHTNAKDASESSETITLLPIQQRVRRLFSKTQSQDDSMISQPVSAPLRRWGSCESGFFSAATDEWIAENGMMSNKSIGSSLLTVSDLEEDLRAASALLSRKRTSSVFSDSLEDISARLDDISNIGVNFADECDSGSGDRYEKDIREIVEYFERNCRVNKVLKSPIIIRSSTENVRSRKIESLIKKVAENKSRARQGRIAAQQQQHQQHLQICDGIVRSKLPLFDHPSPQEQQGRKHAVSGHSQDFLSSLANDVEVRRKQQ